MRRTVDGVHGDVHGDTAEIFLPNPTRRCEGRGDEAFTGVRTCSRRSRPSAACRGAASWANLVDDGELATATVEGNRGEGRRNCPPLRRRGCRGTGARGCAARGGLGSAETASTVAATRRWSSGLKSTTVLQKTPCFFFSFYFSVSL